MCVVLYVKYSAEVSFEIFIIQLTSLIRLGRFCVWNRGGFGVKKCLKKVVILRLFKVKLEWNFMIG